MNILESATMFNPRLDQAEWRYIFDHAMGLGTGEVITYEELGDMLDRDWKTNFSPIYRCMEELEKHKKTLANVPGVGYRVVHPREHEGLARAHHARSKRQLKKTHAKLSSADRSKLSPTERKRIDDLEHNVREQRTFIKRLDRRQEAQEKAIAHAHQRVNTTEAEQDKLRAEFKASLGELTLEIRELKKQHQQGGQ